MYMSTKVDPVVQFGANGQPMHPKSLLFYGRRFAGVLLVVPRVRPTVALGEKLEVHHLKVEVRGSMGCCAALLSSKRHGQATSACAHAAQRTQPISRYMSGVTWLIHWVSEQ